MGNLTMPAAASRTLERLLSCRHTRDQESVYVRVLEHRLPRGRHGRCATTCSPVSGLSVWSRQHTLRQFAYKCSPVAPRYADYSNSAPTCCMRQLPAQLPPKPHTHICPNATNGTRLHYVSVCLSRPIDLPLRSVALLLAPMVNSLQRHEHTSRVVEA